MEPFYQFHAYMALCTMARRQRDPKAIEYLDKAWDALYSAKETYANHPLNDVPLREMETQIWEAETACLAIGWPSARR